MDTENLIILKLAHNRNQPGKFHANLNKFFLSFPEHKLKNKRTVMITYASPGYCLLLLLLLLLRFVTETLKLILDDS